jgi:hypothetical protein
MNIQVETEFDPDKEEIKAFFPKKPVEMVLNLHHVRLRENCKSVQNRHNNSINLQKQL